MIGIVDYGMGNLRSVQKGLEKVGAAAAIVRDAPAIDAAEKLILPGVGAFGDAMKHLHERGLTDAVRRFAESGRPFLGICLGLQLLFEASQEDPGVEGLGLVRGRCVRFAPTDHALKVPHMGWNALTWNGAAPPLMRDLEPGCYVYFVHSYHAAPADDAVVATTTDYDGPFCSSIHVGNISATQFHPEKSQRVGLTMLRSFASL